MPVRIPDGNRCRIPQWDRLVKFITEIAEEITGKHAWRNFRLESLVGFAEGIPCEDLYRKVGVAGVIPNGNAGRNPLWECLE